MFAPGASPCERQQSFAIMCIATSLAYEGVSFPLHVSQIFVAILVALKGFVESGNAGALEQCSCFHSAKVIRILENGAI